MRKYTLIAVLLLLIPISTLAMDTPDTTFTGVPAVQKIPLTSYLKWHSARDLVAQRRLQHPKHQEGRLFLSVAPLREADTRINRFRRIDILFDNFF